jgi:hypothetical protein
MVLTRLYSTTIFSSCPLPSFNINTSPVPTLSNYHILFTSLPSCIVTPALSQMYPNALISLPCYLLSILCNGIMISIIRNTFTFILCRSLLLIYSDKKCNFNFQVLRVLCIYSPMLLVFGGVYHLLSLHIFMYSTMSS